VTQAVLDLALQLADEAKAKNRWATLQITDAEVKVEVGPINSHGQRDHKSATYKVYSDLDGNAHFITYVHP